MIDELMTTVVHRPYVFIFLAAYLFLAWRRWGWPRTVLWLISGYSIAWASEFSSIHIGFPYGEYHYLYENLRGELMIAGVPFFDSLSYPFLIFAGYTTAEFLLPLAKKPSLVLFGALLTTSLDVIIDPLAKLGSQWFLGDIYYYADKGWYFGVPFSNFVGWFLVSLSVIAFNVTAWKIFSTQLAGRPSPRKAHEDILHPLFFLGIATFNIAITFWIKAYLLGVSSSAIFLIILTAIGMRWSRCGRA